MSDFHFPLDAYLARIETGPVPVSETGLIDIQSAQQAAIPFETIDVFLGRTPSLALPDIVAKTVHGARGGYCLELNRLLAEALAASGFRVRSVLARVRMGAPEGGPRTHHVLIVSVGGRDWLADAGFGGSGPLRPMPLEHGRIDEHCGDRFRIVRDARTGASLLQKAVPEGWFDLYGFQDEEMLACDFEAANIVCSRWAKAPFPNHLMLAIRTARGRTTMLDRRLTHSLPGSRVSCDLARSSDLARSLVEDFGIRLQDADLDRLAARLFPGVEAFRRAA